MYLQVDVALQAQRLRVGRRRDAFSQVVVRALQLVLAHVAERRRDAVRIDAAADRQHAARSDVQACERLAEVDPEGIISGALGPVGDGAADLEIRTPEL